MALLVWARVSFSQGQFRVVPAPAGGPMLIRGPYRFLRHPMYAGALLLLWSSVLGHWPLYGALHWRLQGQLPFASQMRNACCGSTIPSTPSTRGGPNASSRICSDEKSAGAANADFWL